MPEEQQQLNLEQAIYRNLLAIKGVVSEVEKKAEEIIAGPRKLVLIGLDDLFRLANELQVLREIHLGLNSPAPEPPKELPKPDEQ